MKQYTFSQLPSIKRPRSRFDLSAKRLTSANVGELIPFYIQEVYPGDTMKINANCVTRLSTAFLKPIMDNLFLDTYFFYVPSRILYENFVNVFGENVESAWANEKEYTIPMAPVGQVVKSKTVGDYLGLPVGSALNSPVSILPFRAFAKIYEDWFRDENNVDPMHIQKAEFNSLAETLNNDEWAPGNYTGLCPKVAKFHDYFTTCLPAPQKGVASSLPIATANDVPVYSSTETTPMELNTSAAKVAMVGPGVFNPGNYALYASNTQPSSNSFATLTASTASDSGVPSSVGFRNLWAQTSSLTLDPVTVNDLRTAFQLQKMLERDARGGTRFCEYLLAFWGVSAGDSRLQRSEFLGGKRTPLNVQQVAQTSAPSETDPLAQMGAYSLTASRARATKGFVENGYVIGVCCIRQFHTYQQGIQKFWLRQKRTDFYQPVFANIGEQPIEKNQLYGFGTQQEGQQVFGYNEAWADLRYCPNMVTGKMRTGVDGSMDIWHLADNYSSAPTLSKAFIEETPIYLDRVIAAESSVQDQFILDFYVQNIAFRELPTYSVPSLIDHN